MHEELMRKPNHESKKKERGIIEIQLQWHKHNVINYTDALGIIENKYYSDNNMTEIIFTYCIML